MKKEIILRLEKGANYHLINEDIFFKNYSSDEINLLLKISDVQKIDLLQLKDLIDCEGILKDSPIIIKL